MRWSWYNCVFCKLYYYYYYMFGYALHSAKNATHKCVTKTENCGIQRNATIDRDIATYISVNITVNLPLYSKQWQSIFLSFPSFSWSTQLLSWLQLNYHNLTIMIGVLEIQILVSSHPRTCRKKLRLYFSDNQWCNITCSKHSKYKSKKQTARKFMMLLTFVANCGQQYLLVNYEILWIYCIKSDTPNVATKIIRTVK